MTSKMIDKRDKVSINKPAWKYICEVNNISRGDIEKIAIIEGEKKFTYSAMFAEWRRYAAVFSSLGMTGDNNSRVGIFGSTCAGTVFSIYGLNMVGAGVSIIPAYSALAPSRVINTIREEKLTDFIATDDFMQPNLAYELFKRKRELGLKNIIILHAPMEGVTVNPVITMMQEMKPWQYIGWYGFQHMEDLLKRYGGRTIKAPGKYKNDPAFVLHTSGTTGGAGKPVALSDKAFNVAVSRFYEMEGLDLPDSIITATIVDLSNVYGMIDQIHLPFAMGGTVVLVPGGVLNPFFYKAIPHYGITFLFAISAMFDRWIKLPESKVPDFSSLKFVVFGGTQVSASDKQRYYEFIKKYGGRDIQLRNGYGISELGGACFLSSPDIYEESIGFPLEGVELRLYDEEKGIFYSKKDAPCEGVLYLNAPSMANPLMDGEEIMKVERIEGRTFICTNDLAGLDREGKLTFLGRANRFFLHDDGIKYESGRVETEISRQAGIESCCVVPVYVKTTHDNIPMLCVKTLKRGEDKDKAGSDNGLRESRERIRTALRSVFITEKTLSLDNIPLRIKIVKEFPRNANGKIDLYKVSRGEVEGNMYKVNVIRIGSTASDIRLIPYREKSDDMIQEVFDGISAEIKNNLPFNKPFFKTNNQEANMKDAKKMFEGFNMMNDQSKKMMMDMMGKMGGMKMPQGFKMPFAQFMNSMPDMGPMGKMMGSQMKQMLILMQEMNTIALNMMQQMFEQNYKMTEQFFDMMHMMNSQMSEFVGTEPKPKKEAESEEAALKSAPKSAPKSESIRAPKSEPKKKSAKKTAKTAQTSKANKTTKAKK